MAQAARYFALVSAIFKPYLDTTTLMQEPGRMLAHYKTVVVGAEIWKWSRWE